MQFAKIAVIGGGFDMEKNYNLKEAAYFLGISVRTVREWIRARKLTAKKYVCRGEHGKSWFISESELVRVQNSMK